MAEDKIGASTRLSYGRDRILFVAYGSAHIAKVAPVVKELERRGVDCVVMALTLGYAQAVRLGLRPLGYKDFLHLVDDPRRALEAGESLVADNSHPDVERAESVCYLGINFMEWVNSYGVDEAKRRYLEGGRRTFKPVNFMKRVLAEIRPVAVVSTSSPRSEQAVIEAAAECGIPSLTMMDSFALPAEPYHKHRVRADRVTVMSDVVKRNLVAQGMEPQRIVVTGCPGFDIHFSPHLGAAAKAFKDSLGWQNLSVVLWAGGIEETPDTPEALAGPRLAMAVEQRLREYVRSRDDAGLIIRYHPSQYHLFAPAGGQARVHISNPAQEPVELDVRAADTVVVQASTVGFEAALVGKRVLCLTYSPAVQWTGLDYARMGYAEAVSSPDALVPTLCRPAELLRAEAALPAAAPAVADVILQLVQERRAGAT